MSLDPQAPLNFENLEKRRPRSFALTDKDLRDLLKELDKRLKELEAKCA